MTGLISPSPPAVASRRSSIAVAWIAALLVSSLGDIFLFEITGEISPWLLAGKVGLLCALILFDGASKQGGRLRPFFVMLLAMTLLMRANTWLLGSGAWTEWQNRQSFTVAALAVQALEMTVALALVGILFPLRRERRRFFLVRGHPTATIQPVGWLRLQGGSVAQFGFIFTVVVVVSQFFLFMFPLPAPDRLRGLLPLVPVVLVLAASNAFNEEIILRAAPISSVYEVVGRSHAIWIAAVLFGLSHYIGGIPSGIPGVLITVFLGWFFGKCMLDSDGFFSPWLFHALQDILPFTLMALAALS